MKRCPSCGNTYTNDALVFCLEDGSRLASVSASEPGFDPQATLRVEQDALPPPTDFKSQGAQTHRQAAPPLTAPPRTPPNTSDNQTTAAAAPPAPRGTSPVVVAALTAIVVLLLVVAGIGVALLLRNSSSNGNTAGVENKSRAANSKADASSTPTSANGASYDSPNRTNTNGASRGDDSTLSSAERAEAKVVRGEPVEASDLASLSGAELRRLRNAVYARHGRTFDSADLQRYFDSRPWYRPRSDYSESSLTTTDRANVSLIQAYENR